MLVLLNLHDVVHWPTQGGYNFVSGPLADITLVTAFASAVVLWWRRHNCHVNRCWRLQGTLTPFTATRCARSTIRTAIRFVGSAALRELREEDADAVVALYRAAFGDERPLDAQEIVSWVHNQEFEPEQLRVLEIEGRIVGYGDLWPRGDDMVLDVAAPNHWHPFLDWAEGRGRDARCRRVRLGFPPGHELEALARERGYRLWRSGYTMELTFGEAPLTARRLPHGFELRTFHAGDEEPLRAAVNEAFTNDPFFEEASPSEFREFYLGGRGFDPELWFLAWELGEIAGCALAYPERVGEERCGWIGTLAVRAAWRRRGLGEALLRTAIGALYERGLERVGLGVDTQNETGALRLYERVGMRPVRRYDSWVLDL